MNFFDNVSLFEHGQYLIDAGAGFDQRPSIPVEDEVAVLIFAKAKKNCIVVGIENGGQALTVVHHGRNTGAGEAFRTQLVAKRRQDAKVGRGKTRAVKRFAVKGKNRHWAARVPRPKQSRCAALANQGNQTVNSSAP